EDVAALRWGRRRWRRRWKRWWRWRRCIRDHRGCSRWNYESERQRGERTRKVALGVVYWRPIFSLRLINDASGEAVRGSAGQCERRPIRKLADQNAGAGRRGQAGQEITQRKERKKAVAGRVQGRIHVRNSFPDLGFEPAKYWG